jgi:hypothetical protein
MKIADEAAAVEAALLAHSRRNQSRRDQRRPSVGGSDRRPSFAGGADRRPSVAGGFDRRPSVATPPRSYSPAPQSAEEAVGLTSTSIMSAIEATTPRPPPGPAKSSILSSVLARVHFST